MRKFLIKLLCKLSIIGYSLPIIRNTKYAYSIEDNIIYLIIKLRGLH
jgi:hypothetical protein